MRLGDAYQRGYKAAVYKFAANGNPVQPLPQGSKELTKNLGSKVPGLPRQPRPSTDARAVLPSPPKKSPVAEDAPVASPVVKPGDSLGAKAASAVGMGYSTGRAEGPGAVPGQPADEGRRQRSVVDRTFQQNEDYFAGSSMPAPGGQVSP